MPQDKTHPTAGVLLQLVLKEREKENEKLGSVSQGRDQTIMWC